MRRLSLILLFVLILSPALVWASLKPLKVLVADWVPGISCQTDFICLDDVSRYSDALALYDEALEFVSANVGEIEEKPRFIFCSTQSCFQSFGFNRASAQAIGTFGIVIGPKGWKDYYLRHELIHHLQAEKMGMVAQWRSPGWFKEGMAYSLSEDPRVTLSTQHQNDRERFARWFEGIGKKGLWEAPLK